MSATVNILLGNVGTGDIFLPHKCCREREDTKSVEYFHSRHFDLSKQEKAQMELRWTSSRTYWNTLQNGAIVNVNGYTCPFPALISQNVCRAWCSYQSLLLQASVDFYLYSPLTKRCECRNIILKKLVFMLWSLWVDEEKQNECVVSENVADAFNIAACYKVPDHKSYSHASSSELKANITTLPSSQKQC